MSDRIGKAQMSGIGLRIAALYAVLVGANLAAWAWALVAFDSYPVLLGTALLAYSFGLRHAVDADHIAAIDNVTRGLMQTGERPVMVGFYFSLGHSTVVVLASIGIALTAGALESRFALFRGIGGAVGTGVSALFLFAIAGANIAVLAAIYRSFQRVKRGGRLLDGDLDLLLAGRGLMSRVVRPMFRLVSKSRHMYLLGFLFGLGFDTATEIGLLGISAAEAAKGLPIWSILIFPALFTAGMALVDATDNVLMLGVYGWALVKPVRKLYYNLTITFASVVIALVIGGVEALGLAAEHLGLSGGFWEAIAGLNGSFGMLGYLVIAVFAASWIVSLILYKLKGYDRLEESV